jgi:hypothetical protein
MITKEAENQSQQSKFVDGDIVRLNDIDENTNWVKVSLLRPEDATKIPFKVMGRIIKNGNVMYGLKYQSIVVDNVPEKYLEMFGSNQPQKWVINNDTFTYKNKHDITFKVGDIIKSTNKKLLSTNGTIVNLTRESCTIRYMDNDQHITTSFPSTKFDIFDEMEHVNIIDKETDKEDDSNDISTNNDQNGSQEIKDNETKNIHISNVDIHDRPNQDTRNNNATAV